MRGASARDIRDLADLYGLDDEERQRLADLAQAGKQRAWWEPLSLPYSTYVGLEADATSIRDFGLGVMPGLLQTPDYARAVLDSAVPHLAPDEVEHLIDGRIARQQRVLSGESPPQFQAILETSVLHRVVGSRSTMRAQLQRLLELSRLPNVMVRVVIDRAEETERYSSAFQELERLAATPGETREIVTSIQATYSEPSETD